MRYSIFSGTNTWSECAGAVAALIGLRPLLEGPAIAEYERSFAEAAGTRYAFSFAAGRQALYRLLEALDIGTGDEVILPAFTCVVVPNAILYRGARPVFVDIAPGTFNIDPGLIAAQVTPRTRAIIAQHTFGRVCDIDAVSRVAERHRLPVLEDCAHALGAALRGRKAGSLGQAAFFSTDHSKVISTSTGGMITTDDPGLAARLRSLQQGTPFLPAARVRRILATFVLEYALLHPAAYPLGRWVQRAGGRLGAWAYFPDELLLEKPAAYPFPARLSNAQAEIGKSQLALLPENLAWRRRAADAYRTAAGAPAEAGQGEPAADAALRYTFLAEDRRAWELLYRDVLDMGIWFTSVVQGRDRDLEAVGYRLGSCPVAETAARHCVNLPTHPRITRPDQLAKRLSENRSRMRGGVPR